MKKVVIVVLVTAVVVFVSGCGMKGGSLVPIRDSSVTASSVYSLNLSASIKNPQACQQMGDVWKWYTTSWNRSYCVPRTVEMCLQYNGIWSVLGNSTESVCNIRASDVGRNCINSSECMGDCVASLSVEQLKKLIVYRNESIWTNGTCSEYVITTGPVAEVKSGKWMGYGYGFVDSIKYYE